jgi:hypothetical protein
MKISEQKLRQLIRESIIHEMNSLQENFNQDKPVLLEANPRMTAGELRQALKKVSSEKDKKKVIELGKKMGLWGAKTALTVGFGPVGGLIATAIDAGLDTKDLIKKAKDLSPEAKKSSPLWDVLSIDPDVSDVVHDSIEDKFLDAYGRSVQDLDDDAIIPDADIELNRWIKRKYNGVDVKKVASED